MDDEDELTVDAGADMREEIRRIAADARRGAAGDGPPTEPRDDTPGEAAPVAETALGLPPPASSAVIDAPRPGVDLPGASAPLAGFPPPPAGSVLPSPSSRESTGRAIEKLPPPSPEGRIRPAPASTAVPPETRQAPPMPGTSVPSPASTPTQRWTPPERMVAPTEIEKDVAGSPTNYRVLSLGLALVLVTLVLLLVFGVIGRGNSDPIGPEDPEGNGVVVDDGGAE